MESTTKTVSVPVLLNIDHVIEKLKREQKLETFTEIRDVLAKQNPNLGFRETEDLCLIYHNIDAKLNSLEDECRSYIFDKEKLVKICNQCPRVLYDGDAEAYLQENKTQWDFIEVHACYKETLLTVFNHKGVRNGSIGIVNGLGYFFGNVLGKVVKAFGFLAPHFK